MSSHTTSIAALIEEICREPNGQVNQSAKSLCLLYFRYCHDEDDAQDSIEDGRPTVSNEFLLNTRMELAFVYNHPFYVQHQAFLFPVIMMVLNEYADSVLFEKSPEPEKRAIADVIRCCGNNFFYAVALICGGIPNMRRISPLVRHLSWRLQHSDKPEDQF